MTQGKNSDKNKLTYQDLSLPTYINTRNVMLNLNASDMALAAVLGGLNLALLGKPGNGKSQLAYDIYRNVFVGTH